MISLQSLIVIFYFLVSTPELRPCVIPMSGNQGFPDKKDIMPEIIEFNAKYGLAVDCVWEITVKEGWRVSIALALQS